MVVTKFPISGCEYQTSDDSSDVVCSLLSLHKVRHEQSSGSLSGSECTSADLSKGWQANQSRGVASLHSQMGGVQG